MSDISLDEQEPSALGFVQGLVEAFGADAEVEAHAVDDEHLEISVTGEDLGLLVGPRGSTLNAIQELTRTAVAQQHSGRLEGRLRVDVAGYRARRKEAEIVRDLVERPRHSPQRAVGFGHRVVGGLCFEVINCFLEGQSGFVGDPLGGECGKVGMGI